MEDPKRLSFHNQFNRIEMEKCLSEDVCTLLLEYFLVLQSL